MLRNPSAPKILNRGENARLNDFDHSTISLTTKRSLLPGDRSAGTALVASKNSISVLPITFHPEGEVLD